MSQRVVITGAGWITPLGVEIPEVWDRLVAGQSGVGPISLFDASNFPGVTPVPEYQYGMGITKDPETGLPLKIVRQTTTHANAFGGEVEYNEQVTLVLASLTPRR